MGARKLAPVVDLVPDREPLMNEHEVAERLGVRVGLLREWRYLDSKDDGRRGPRYRKLGRLVRYRPSDVDAFVEGR